MSVRQVRNFMRDILSGLKYLHQLKIVHRDIKMSNLLVTVDKRIKICDFGLSTRLGANNIEEKEISCACGTVNYLPPELLGPTFKLTTGADVWSAGVVMYGLLVGKLPFTGSVEAYTFVRIKYHLYDMPEHILLKPGGTSAARLLQQIFSVDRIRRPSASALLSDNFFQNDQLMELLVRFMSFFVIPIILFNRFCIKFLIL